MAKANDSLAVYVSQCDDVQRMRDQMLTFNNTTCAVFPMAHCGVFGTNNRKDPGTGCSGIKQQEEDWRRIKYCL